jgi:hypothetical protein
MPTIETTYIEKKYKQKVEVNTNYQLHVHG